MEIVLDTYFNSEWKTIIAALEFAAQNTYKWFPYTATDEEAESLLMKLAYSLKDQLPKDDQIALIDP